MTNFSSPSLSTNGQTLCSGRTSWKHKEEKKTGINEEKIYKQIHQLTQSVKLRIDGGEF